MTASHPQVVQTTGNFHSHIRETLFKIAEGILENATAFNASNDMFNLNPETSNDAIEKEILGGKFSPSRLFLAEK
jgi:hypothetical protein